MSRVLKSVLASIAVAALMFGFEAQHGHAALDTDTAAAPSTGLEILVVEVEGCLYCMLFRRDVAKAYKASRRAKSVPMRFTHLSAIDKPPKNRKLTLKGPVESVPTVILLKDNVEVGRIPGYTGPENFFHAINFMILGAR